MAGFQAPNTKAKMKQVKQSTQKLATLPPEKTLSQKSADELTKIRNRNLTGKPEPKKKVTLNESAGKLGKKEQKMEAFKSWYMNKKAMKGGSK
jgi:hypothetical protein